MGDVERNGTERNGAELAGIGALKRLSQTHAEIKSMRTAKPYLRRGVASRLLSHIMREAKLSGYSRLSLETGSMEYFQPARAGAIRFIWLYPMCAIR